MSDKIEALLAENGRLQHAANGLSGELEELRAIHTDAEAETKRLASDNDWAAHEITRLQSQNERLRAALQGIADNPDPLEGKCYCRWSKSVAKQALASTRRD